MKNPLRLMLLIVAMMLLGFSARAGSITEEQAKAKAWSFLQTRHPMPSGKRLAPATMPRELHSTPAATQTLYVFNVGEQDGFVIVSGDDRTRSILGYAEKGSFDADNMPTALREMLAIYARQIEQLAQSSSPAPTDSASRAARARHRISSTMADVTPLLTTTWDQGAPYNNYCPTLNDQTALTGCVATAMAQIANYHKYPTAQVPSLAAYTSETNKINVSAWGATTFDWDNMLDSYNGSVTNAQKAAVATLMRYCGQAAQMDYGFSSGAYNGDALYAFKEKLGYNANAEFRSAASYSTNGWEDLIYKEVREGRPVYYSALDGDVGCDVSGHAFVIDGYQADGNYFHVNWGWGGLGDGFFNLFALDPNAPQSPVTTTGWHYQMLALIGLSPETVNTAKLVQDASGSWLITNAGDWNELSGNLETYNGGSFKLTTDISVTTMVGSESVPFSGTFDGQGHTLTVNYIIQDKYSWEDQGQAPFRYIQGANIKNLHVAGNITISDIGVCIQAAGIAGLAQNSPCTIENCWSSVTIDLTGSDEENVCCSGFVGTTNTEMTLTDCLFDGALKGENADWNGGLIGAATEWTKFVNCLQAGTFETSSWNSYTFCRCPENVELINCYYLNAYGNENVEHGIATKVTSNQLADGSIARALQDGQRDWTTGQVWGQQLGIDTMPVLSNDANKGIYKVSFSLNGQVVKSVFANSTIGDKMPTGEELGLANATFTYNGGTFTSTTPISSDITVIVTGTQAYTLTLGTPSNGSISINNNSCMPGTVKKVTVIPANGYIVNTVTVTDANGKLLPVTQVSNNANEYVFAFPMSSVTVNAEFIAGEAEPTQFINGGLTLPSSWRSGNQPWTADTWMIWGDEYDGTDNVIVGAPPTDALGRQWYEEGYALTNNDADMQPNGNKIVWENHAASFSDGGNYDYFIANGAGWNVMGDFYIRRIFTFNTQTVPTKLYLSCSYDDSPVEYYINGTLVYQDHNTQSWHDDCYEVELTPDQIALIHTDGTPNVLAAHASQNWGGYHLDCGLYDPTAISYEVTGENTVRVLPNAFMSGDVTIPETVTSNGVTYTVTELASEAFFECYDLTSVILPPTLTIVGDYSFWNCDNLQYVKSYVPVYQEQTLIAAPADATDFELSVDCSSIYRNAFKFTESLQTLSLPRALTFIDENAFVGCTALTEIYAYARPVPQTEDNAFEGLDKSKITVHVYASALNSYKESWGEDFQYVTMTDPQPITLTIDVATAGTLGTLIDEAAVNQGSTIYDVTGITVTGTINQDDLRTLSAMCTGVYSLATIDLSGLTIENNYIDSWMFYDKEKLTSIILPETLEYINERAFSNCDGLTAIDIPATVKRISNNAFADCYNLATVTGLEGLSEIDCNNDWDPFWGTAITQPLYGGSVFLYMPPTITGEYEMPAGIKMTAPGSIRQSQLSSIILPASLTDLGNDTFYECWNLTDIYCYATTPPICHDGVWEDWAFNRDACTVHVPASVLEDYQNAGEWNEMGRIVPIFSGDEVVVRNGILMYVPASTTGEFTIPEGVVEIADNAFNGCSLITKLIIGSEVILNDKSLKGLSDVVEIVACQDIYLDQTLYVVGNTTTDYVIPEDCAVIHPYAFKNSTALRSLTTQSLVVIEPQENSLAGLSPSVTIYVYESMLEDYKQIWGDNYDYQTIPDPEIGGKTIAFISVDGMWTESAGVWTSQNHDNDSSAEITASLSVTAGETLVLDWSVSSEEGYDWLCGFWNEEQILGESGISSGTLNYTFQNTENGTLKFVYSKDGSVNANEDNATIGSSQSVQVGNFTLKIGNDNVSVVATTLTGDITVPESFRILGKTYPVVAFEKSLFSNNKLFTSVSLPSTITRIPAFAFYGCESLTSITMGDNVRFIGDYAFDGCVGLTEIPIPTGVESIGSYAFARTGITSITIPDAVTQMGGRGVQSCGSLTSITLGNGLTYIPECWAESCGSLEDVTIGKKITSLGWRAFSGSEIKNVYCHAKNPPSWNDSFYDGINTEAILHVYSNYLTRYEEANGWKEFLHIVGDLGTYPSIDLAVNVTTTGKFDEALATVMTAAGCEDMADISKLTVTGNINLDDLNYLLNNLGATLDVLDMGAVTVEGNNWGDNGGGYGFEELILPATLTGHNGWDFLVNMPNLKTIHLPDNFYFTNRVLNDCPLLETVTGCDGAGIDEWGGPYFADCPSLNSPVILGSILFRLPLSTDGVYEVPDHVTTIASWAMGNVSGLTELSLPESISQIYVRAFSDDVNLKDIYFYALEVPYTMDAAFDGFDRTSCTLHVYEEMTVLFQENEIWSEFNIVGDLGPMPNTSPMNEADYADLCNIYNTLGGDSWSTKWLTNSNVQITSRWHGVTFDEEGYVTSIDLSNNGLNGDISSLTFTGFTRLTSLNMSNNAITGNIQPLAASLPNGCALNVEHQDLGYVGEHTLYEMCNYTNLPSIAYYQSQSGTSASNLIGVGGVCQFYHEGTGGGHYWDCYIYADGSTWNNFKFYWPSPVTVECFYPHHFTFTYSYPMGDANMDDGLNVLDLQTTLNYSNGHQWGLFNFYAADTYGQDDDINVQDIVATVNILLEQDDYPADNSRAGSNSSRSKIANHQSLDACVTVENGQVVLYTTVPVAALDLRLAGIEPDALNWNTEAMGFATATMTQSNGTHAVIYSIQPREIEEGRTVLATFDAAIYEVSPYSVVLSDSKARSISVGNTVPTGISQIATLGSAARWSLTDLSGVVLATGTHATETDILRMAKSQKLQGVFILNTDGRKRKIVIN